MPSEIKGSSNFDSDSVGKVLNVWYANKTSAITSTVAYTLTDATITVTPLSSTSKFLVTASVNMGADGSNRYGLWLLRDGTPMYQGDAYSSTTSVSTGGSSSASTRQYTHVMSYLYGGGSTASTTFAIKADAEGSAGFAINRAYGDTGASSHFRGASTLTVIEIDGA